MVCNWAPPVGQPAHKITFHFFCHWLCYFTADKLVTCNLKIVLLSVYKHNCHRISNNFAKFLLRFNFKSSTYHPFMTIDVYKEGKWSDPTHWQLVILCECVKLWIKVRWLLKCNQVNHHDKKLLGILLQAGLKYNLSQESDVKAKKKWFCKYSVKEKV